MKTALLVIDYIKGIIDGSCKDYAKNHPIVANTNKLIAGCRKINIPIYFIRLAFNANYDGLPKYSRRFNYIKENGLFQIGSDSVEFVEELDYRSNDMIINKTAASPFHNKTLIAELNSKNIE